MFLPFTYPFLIKSFLKSSKTILDIGCGDGSFMALLNKSHTYSVTGVELFPAYIKRAQKTGAYKNVLKHDIRKLTFHKKSFDSVLSSQVIEHITKKEGEKLLEDMEKIARNRVIIGTPNGHFHQEAYDENKLQKHKSHWTIKDFEQKGYTVYGQGLKLVYGEEGLLQKYTVLPMVKGLLFALSYISSPFTYLFPQYAAHIIAVKTV